RRSGMRNADFGMRNVRPEHRTPKIEDRRPNTEDRTPPSSSSSSISTLNAGAREAGDRSTPNTPMFGHMVAPGVLAVSHQHFFNFRLDMDVDGASPNHVVEVDTHSLPPGPGNPALNAFTMTE